jgi:hypothetical protein
MDTIFTVPQQIGLWIILWIWEYVADDNALQASRETSATFSSTWIFTGHPKAQEMHLRHMDSA